MTVVGVITPVVRVPVLSVQIRSTYASSGILFGFFARILNRSIVLTFCFVTSLIINGSPSGTAATMIVRATEIFCAIFWITSSTPPLIYSLNPICAISVTISAINVTTAAIVPYLEIVSQSLSIAI